jgi:tetratricopeptide (TPR) repeat protein
MNKAHLLPLGDEPVREKFASDLQKRGYDAAARQERQLLIAVRKPMSFVAAEALRDASLEAIDRKDYLKAAVYQDRALFRVLEPDIDYVESSAYIAVPAYIHRLRALGLATEGRVNEVRKEAEAALELLPGNIELTIQLVPVLDKLGRKKDSDELFKRTLALRQQMCTDYPRGAWVHNNLAWLSACCHRNLDAALEHARKAVELDPETIGYLDTLAEVHFQRGESDKAIELMRQCRAREPKNEYFQKQLQRFEAGDRGTEPPAGDR